MLCGLQGVDTVGRCKKCEEEKEDDRLPAFSSFLDQFGLSCARVERVSPDERLNAARQVHDEIYKNALMPLLTGANAVIKPKATTGLYS